MKTLLIDAGNTRLKWTCLLEDRLSAVEQAPNSTLPDTRLLQRWSRCEPAEIHVACVAPEPVRQWLEQSLPPLAPTRFHHSPARTGPLINAYPQPASLGVDRWCAMLAVPILGTSPFVLADCGTALTLDAVDATGRHLGGCIQIGPTTALERLHARTALPLAQGRPRAQWFNDNTVEAMLHGQWLAAAASVQAFVRACETHLQNRVELFLAGGASATLAELLDRPTTLLDQPVLTGLHRWIHFDTEG